MTQNICINLRYPKSGSTLLMKHILGRHEDVFINTENFENDKKGAYKAPQNLRTHDQSLTVFSNSELTYLNKENNRLAAKKLYDLFGPVKVLFIIREQRKWLESYYLHCVVTGKIPYTMPIEMFLKTLWFSHAHGVSYTVDYNHKIADYEEFHGVENVGVFTFENLQEDLNVFSKQIYDFLGLDPNHLKEKTKGRSPAENLDKGGAPDYMTRMSKLAFFREKYGILPGVELSRYMPHSIYKALAPIVRQKKEITIPETFEQRIVDFYCEGNKALTQRRPELNLEALGYCTKTYTPAPLAQSAKVTSA